MANIRFVEKEPWKNTDRFTGGCIMYPIHMVKDDVEHFMFNRRSDQKNYEAEKDDVCKKQLLNNGGRFFRRYGYKETPYEFLRAVIERRHTFEKFSHKEVEWYEDGRFWDFHGNLKEVSAAFMYRIYDKELASNIEKIVELIHKKKYNEAIEVLNACENKLSVDIREEKNKSQSLETQINAAEKITNEHNSFNHKSNELEM